MGRPLSDLIHTQPTPLIINTSRLSQALFLTVQNPASITQPRQLFFEKQSKRIISPSSLIA